MTDLAIRADAGPALFYLGQDGVISRLDFEFELSEREAAIATALVCLALEGLEA